MHLQAIMYSAWLIPNTLFPMLCWILWQASNCCRPVPLLNAKCSSTTCAAVQLLILGFRLQDDVLNDAELNAFQVRCFNAPLQPEELMGVKKVVQDKMPQVQTSHCRLCFTRSVRAPNGWRSMTLCKPVHQVNRCSADSWGIWKGAVNTKPWRV